MLGGRASPEADEMRERHRLRPTLIRMLDNARSR